MSSLEKRKNYAIQYVRGNNIQGYLAYRDDRVVGWCNVNTKSECLKCYCWRRFMGSIPVEDLSQGLKVKSIFCFAIAPDMKRMGISRQLLERVCQDAALDGFDVVEAYPNKAFIDDAEDFMGPADLFRKSGFTAYCETDNKVVMRKPLK
ncbi:MAG: GNAT family N-acetyltransferase [Anaerolineaceae bacterium]